MACLDIWLQRMCFYSEVTYCGSGWFTGLPFFRVVKGFLTQFGPHPDPQPAPRRQPFKDDPPTKSRLQYGSLFFAGCVAEGEYA